MKSSEFITEALDDSITETRDLIQLNCRPFLQANTPPKCLWRGIKEPGEKINSHLSLLTTHPKRQPRDLLVKLHSAADSWFKEKFGIKFRSDRVMFATGWMQGAAKYSSGNYPHLVFPIGKFDYCWSPEVNDLLHYIGDCKTTKQVHHVLSEMNYRFNTGLADAIASGNEIMIQCNEYYATDLSFNTVLGIQS